MPLHFEGLTTVLAAGGLSRLYIVGTIRRTRRGSCADGCL